MSLFKNSRLGKKLSCIQQKLAFVRAQVKSRELQHQIDLIMQDCEYAKSEAGQKTKAHG